MTTVNDDLIRAFLADEARRAVAAAPSLDEAVGRLAPRIAGRPSGASQRLIVLLAATLLLVAALGAAIAVGSALLRLPAVIDDPGFVGEWSSTDYNDHDSDTSIQTMTIRAGEDGLHRVRMEDESSILCSDAPMTVTGAGRFEDPATLIVSSPTLACADGSDPTDPSGDGPSWLEAASSSYRLVLDLATDRLFDNREVVWTRGTPPETWVDQSTDVGARGSGIFSILHGEVTFRAAAPWNDHFEAYIDPRVFFLLGPGDYAAPDGDTAEFTIFVNPTPPEAPCESLRVPPSAEELVRAVRSNPDLEATVPVTERVGGIDALRMDVVAAPGASIGPCGAARVDAVYVRGRPWGGVELGGRGRLYVLDLPGGSARTLAILITAREAALFEQALDAAAPVLDSFEFHAP